MFDYLTQEVRSSHLPRQGPVTSCISDDKTQEGLTRRYFTMPRYTAVMHRPSLRLFGIRIITGAWGCSTVTLSVIFIWG